MGVSLEKGANVSLDKEAAKTGNALAAVTVGLGWDARSTDGMAFDLDASAFGVGADGKAPGDKWFVFYGNLRSPDGSIVHQGDNLTGDGDGDDEQVKINLPAVPPEIDKIVVAVTIYKAADRNQKFGQVRNAFIRVVNDVDGSELARYDLSEDAATETAMLFGEIYRYNGEWKFRALGQGYASGLSGIAKDYGINAA